MSDKEVNKDSSGSKEIVTVTGDESNKVEASSDAQKKAEKLEIMNKLKLNLKTAKGKVTKVLNKIEPAVVLSEKHENGRGSSKRLNVKAKEIHGQLTKLEKEYEEIDEVVSEKCYHHHRS